MKQTEFNKTVLNAFDEEFVRTRKGNEFTLYEESIAMAKAFSQMTFEEWAELHADTLYATILKHRGAF